MYTKTYTSYAGTDIIATIDMPGVKAKVLGELQTITYSIHREKGQVRALGYKNVKGFAHGPRTIAGTLIFTVFDKHIISHFREFGNVGPRLLTDELPPFNVTITFANEYGDVSKMAIYGVTIVDEGQTMSVDDILTENVFSYMARDIVLLNQDGMESALQSRGYRNVAGPSIKKTST